MTRRRTKLSIAIVVVVLVLLGGAIYLRKEAPPEAARLLPESDGIVYFNLRPLRAATHFDQHPVTHSPEYQRFIDATGIEFERDLDAAAFALHRMANPERTEWPGGLLRRLRRALRRAASGVVSGEHRRIQESYAGRTVYNIPSDGRTVRVALLGYDIVAVSNHPSPEMIHSMIDRYRTAALPFSGSSLLARNYSKVPLLSVAWGIGQIALPLGNNGGARIFGLRLPLPVDAMFIASLRWIGKMHLRIEEIAADGYQRRRTRRSRCRRFWC